MLLGRKQIDALRHIQKNRLSNKMLVEIIFICTYTFCVAYLFIIYLLASKRKDVEWLVRYFDGSEKGLARTHMREHIIGRLLNKSASLMYWKICWTTNYFNPFCAFFFNFDHTILFLHCSPQRPINSHNFFFCRETVLVFDTKMREAAVEHAMRDCEKWPLFPKIKTQSDCSPFL